MLPTAQRTISHMPEVFSSTLGDMLSEVGKRHVISNFASADAREESAGRALADVSVGDRARRREFLAEMERHT